MANILTQLQDNSGNNLFPYTKTGAITDNDGVPLDSILANAWELLWSDYNEHISQAAQTLLTANRISKYSEIMVKIWWSQDTLETTVKSDNNPEFGGSAIMANLKNTRILLGAGKASQYQGWRYVRINTSGDLVITNGYKEPTITTTDNTRGKIYEVWGR